MQQFTGTGVALITPFKKDLSIDFHALNKLVHFNIENGIDYLVICGTTGESPVITFKEKQDLVKAIATTNAGRLPLVLGIGGNNTSEVISEIKATDLSQIDGILSVAPYYSKPTQEGFYQHFKAVAQATDKPIIVYNVPGRTAKNMLPETIVRLANDFENIVAVKEAAGIMSQYLELLKKKPSGFQIISGDDDLALATTLAGGAGVISVIGQALPKDFSEMIRLALQGNAKDAYKIYYKLVDSIGLIFSENNPSGIKAFLNILGICDPTVRLPLVTASDELQEKIKAFVALYAQ